MVTWLVFAVALGAVAALGVYYRRNLAQERTIRRQIAREASLNARLDFVFERSSDHIVVQHDRRAAATRIAATFLSSRSLPKISRRQSTTRSRSAAPSQRHDTTNATA